MNPLPSLIVQNCDTDSRLLEIRPDSESPLGTGRIDLNYRQISIYRRIASGSRRIPLDFCQYTTDNSGNTLAAPLLRTVKCPRNDVHYRRVISEHNARLEPNRITAAPPLMPFRHNAVLGRLLLFGDLPFLRGGPR